MNSSPQAPARGTAADRPQPVALVTGAGRRVGNAIARALGEAGYRLALHAHSSLGGAHQTAEELIAQGMEAIVVRADFHDAASVPRMIDQAHRHFGRLDALVNSAALWKNTRLENTTPADVQEHFAINTLGTFLCCKHAGLLMVQQATGGAIVNLGDWAIARPYQHYAAYFASKGSIPTLTRTFAVELGRRNPRVRVNAVLPGPVLLPEEMSPIERREVIEATLLKHEGSPANVAHAVLFLLENDFVTGVCLPVDGGRSVYAPPL